MLDYTQIEALLAVEDEGSFVDAGKILGISAIGVARRIEKLEKRLGTQLLHRKPTRTSKSGQALCNYAREVISRENDFLTEQRRQGLQPFDVSPSLKIAVDLKWSGKFGQRAKMYPTRTNGYENDKATELFRPV